MLRIIKNTISLIIMILCATQISACNSHANVTSVSAPEFERIISTDSVQILDVRTPQEYAEGYIDGAINIDVRSDDFSRTAEKELSKGSPVLVYCRSGRRSLDAAERLIELGYRVVNLKGGIIEWQDSGLAVVTTEISRQTPE